MFKEVSLINICEIIAGQSPPSTTYNQNGDGIPFFQGKADFGDLNPTVRYWCNKPIKMTQPNDILFSLRAPVGPTNISTINACIGRGLAAIRCKKIELMYLLHYLRGNEDRIAALGSGSTFKAITIGTLKNLKIPLPPLQQQKKIAAILDAADAYRSKTKALIAKYNELSQSLFLDMFGDVDEFEHLPVESIAAKSKYALSSGPFGSNLTSKHYQDDGVIILRGTNVSSGNLDLSNVKYVSKEKAKELKRSALMPGDVVIVAVGSSGKALKVPDNVGELIMSQNFNKITPNLNLVTPLYLEYSFNSQLVQNQFKKEMTDTVRTFLSLTKIKSVTIPIPPLKLQNQFAERIEAIEAQKAKAEASLAKAEDLFNSLLQRAFKGELTN